MSRPGHKIDYTALPKAARRSRARYAASAEGREGTRIGDATSVNNACDAYFRRKNLSPEPFTFGGADLRRSA